MAAHTYWRLNITSVDNGTSINITELGMRTVVGGANVATGADATITASGGTTPAAAFDGNTTTMWSVSGTTGWLQYQFPTAQDIVEHYITPYSSSLSNLPKSWSLQWSDDGNTWTAAINIFGQNIWLPNATRVFTHSAWPPKANIPLDIYNTFDVPLQNNSSPVVAATAVTNKYRSLLSTNIWAILGTPATFGSSNVQNYTKLVPTWALDARYYFPNTGLTFTTSTYNSTGYKLPTVGIPTSAAISGQTQSLGVATPNVKLRLYYRPTGVLISRTTSDSLGNYTFTGLEPNIANYQVVAMSPIDLMYDAVIHDNLTAL
jgi:hypothetical protein